MAACPQPSLQPSHPPRLPNFGPRAHRQTEGNGAQQGEGGGDPSPDFTRWAELDPCCKEAVMAVLDLIIADWEKLAGNTASGSSNGLPSPAEANPELRCVCMCGREGGGHVHV